MFPSRSAHELAHCEESHIIRSISVLGAMAAGLEALPLYAGVHLVEQPGPVRELEVLGEVAVGLLARGAVERHVQRDQPGALGVIGSLVDPSGGWLACRLGLTLCRELLYDVLVDLDDLF